LAGTLTAGTRLGAYEIVSVLGEGGMGAVYRAHDPTLHRDVAIKVLLPEVMASADRLARFQREAQVLASLNHPNIGQIYSFEDGPSGPFLVLELVEGPTLSERITRGVVPRDEVLDIAKQIAEALESAHDHGVVHRDLKPGNIKVRGDGTIKVLDFGLARIEEPTARRNAHVSQSPTLTSPAHVTSRGVILGTAAYMSPEQARGEVADRTADIWAFGCVVYEMLTGRAPFRGASIADVLGEVLKSEPNWALLPGDTPQGLRRLLRRCLKKDRRDRLHDIADAKLELLDLDLDQDSLGAQPAAPRLASVIWIPWGHGAVPVP